MATLNFAGQRSEWKRLVRSILRGHFDLVVVPETRLRREAQCDELGLPPDVGFIHAFRPPMENKLGDPAGGVSILWNKKRVKVQELDKHPEGVIVAKVEQPGAAPFHVFGVYLPTAGFPKAHSSTSC